MIMKALLYSSTVLTISELRLLDDDSIILSDQEKRYYDELEDRCKDRGIRAVTSEDVQYHFKFSQIYSSPYVITMLWNTDLLNQDILGIVWPRKVSSYGKEVMETLFKSVKNFQLTTISWLADGVDMMCHRLSFEHNIPTIAVLWWGLRYFLQSGLKSVIQEIIDAGGLIISEFKLDKKPEQYTFPQRNRIIAGLSDMLFLPEAGKKSGSLITVDFAHKMHKDIYGAPASIFSLNSRGLHEVMQQGMVKSVVDFDSMLDQHFWKKIKKHNPQKLNNDNNLFSDFQESQMVTLLQKNPGWLSLNELVNQSGLSTEEVMSQLSIAEVMGEVKNDGGVWRSI